MADGLPEWTRDADYLEELMHLALKAQDMEGVYSALLLMASVDPHRAAMLRDTILTAIDLARLIRASEGDQ